MISNAHEKVKSELVFMGNELFQIVLEPKKYEFHLTHLKTWLGKQEKQ